MLIDGRSGSGKTTLAAQIANSGPWHVVHLDDFYPGWSGLAEGAQMVARDVLAADNPGYWRWDWVAGVRGEWVSLEGVEKLLVEGVGAVTWASLAAARRRGAVFTIRVECDEQLRRMRALQRDPDFAPWWEMWAEQEEQLAELQAPADLTVRCQ